MVGGLQKDSKEQPESSLSYKTSKFSVLHNFNILSLQLKANKEGSDDEFIAANDNVTLNSTSAMEPATSYSDMKMEVWVVTCLLWNSFSDALYLGIDIILLGRYINLG